MTPRLSIVVPTFNRSAMLVRLLDSIAASQVGSLEIETIVVDDGSSDDTAERIAEVPIPVVLLHQPNRGPAAARNLGWRTASSPLILFLDDDVVLDPFALQRLVAEGDEAAGTGAIIKPLGRTGVVAGFMHEEALSDHRVVDGEVRYLVTCGAMFHRSALALAGGFDEAFPVAAGEDADLSMRLLDAGLRLRVASDAIVFHEYRTNLRSLVRTYYRHGSVQPLLRERHADRDAQLRSSVRERLSLSAWFATFRRYRAGGARVPRAAIYLVLRVAMMFPWVLGAVIAQRRHSRRIQEER